MATVSVTDAGAVVQIPVWHARLYELLLDPDRRHPNQFFLVSTIGPDDVPVTHLGRYVPAVNGRVFREVAACDPTNLTAAVAALVVAIKDWPMVLGITPLSCPTCIDLLGDGRWPG